MRATEAPGAKREGMEVRISGGSSRGRKLRAQGGAELRPTSEKARSAIFAMIGADSVKGCRTLDLYAGTGAMGIEALSRGAASAVFVEANPVRCRGIEMALEEFGFAERGRVVRGKVERILRTMPGKFDLAVADPPYADDPWESLLGLLVERELLEEGAVVVAEHASTQEITAFGGALSLWKRRRYGDTGVTLMRYGGG